MPNAETAAGWNAEYRAGRWAFLSGVEEVARTGIIAAWLRTTDCDGRILDVGCGEAALFRHLDRSRLQAYVGIDLSAVALARAKVAAPPARLVEADLCRFAPAPSERFSAIVFNEVLYLAEDPARELRRYAEFLIPGGVIALSIYAPWSERGSGHARLLAVEDEIEGGAWTSLDALELTSIKKNVRWRLRLVRRSRQGVEDGTGGGGSDVAGR